MTRMESKEGFNLKLKPINDGLGLDHFSDGLPYTPDAAKRRAVVNFQYPPPRAPQEKPSVVTPPPSPALEFTKEVIGVKDFSYARFPARSFSYFFDLIVVNLIFAFILWSGFLMNDLSIKELYESSQLRSLWLVCTGLYFVVYLGYFLIQESIWKATIGKTFFKLHIECNSVWSIFLRTVLHIVSILPFGVGLFWYFFDSKNRCWHDLITDSMVVNNDQRVRRAAADARV